MVGKDDARRGPRIEVGDLLHPVRRLFGESPGVTWGAIVLIALVSLVLVRPLANSFLSWHRTAGLLQERRAEVADLRAQHDVLQDDLAFYETDQFVVEQARIFGLVMPGEESYVLRELVHPESAGRFAITRLRNATVDHDVALAGR